MWRVLAGTVIAVGLLGAFTTYGADGMLLGYATLSLIAVVFFWGLSQELPIERWAAVRLGFGTALVGLALFGLCELFPSFGFPVAAVVALGSRPARWLGRRLRQLMRRASTAGPQDQVALDQAFDDIVRHLGRSRDLPET